MDARIRLHADPVDNTLSLLKKVKKNGTGWTALCPAHDDHNPSLGIYRLDSGKAKVKCFAGCNDKDVLAAIDLKVSDLFPLDDSKQISRQREKTDKPKKVHASRERVLGVSAWYVEEHHGTGWLLACAYKYPDGFEILRYERDGQKTFTSIHQHEKGWSFGDPPGLLPLYRRDTVADIDWTEKRGPNRQACGPCGALARVGITC